MAEAATKLPVKNEQKTSGQVPASREWQPFASFRREIERLFDDFDRGFYGHPFRRTAFEMEPPWSRAASWEPVPAVDVVEKSHAYEITAELPGMDENNIEVNLANETLTIKGEKKHEKEEKKKGYYVSERQYGSFERSFRIPGGVDKDKIEAAFKNGVLTLTLPKTAEAQKPQQKIAIKTS
jgi:HSP20 family protein